MVLAVRAYFHYGCALRCVVWRAIVTMKCSNHSGMKR